MEKRRKADKARAKWEWCCRTNGTDDEWNFRKKIKENVGFEETNERLNNGQKSCTLHPAHLRNVSSVSSPTFFFFLSFGRIKKQRKDSTRHKAIFPIQPLIVFVHFDFPVKHHTNNKRGEEAKEKTHSALTALGNNSQCECEVGARMHAYILHITKCRMPMQTNNVILRNGTWCLVPAKSIKRFFFRSALGRHLLPFGKYNSKRAWATLSPRVCEFCVQNT